MTRLRRSTVIDAPIDQVWSLLRDFNGHERWHPAVIESRIEEGQASDKIGAVRRFKLEDGGELREQLLTLSDRDHRFTYCILEAPIPLIGYVSTIELRPVTDGNRTFWDWRCEFRSPPGEEAELTALVGEQIYEAGFDAVKRAFNQPVPPRAHLDEATSAVSRAPSIGSGAAMPSHAVILERHGGPENLVWQDIVVPPPAAGEIRLRHSAIGVNFIDIYCRTGYFPLVTPPAPLGMEGAGIVLDVGAGVTGFASGDRVAYAGPLGSYAEIRDIPTDLVVPLPPAIDEETAAAALLKGMTAEFLLHRCHKVKEGDIVLVHAASGGVGNLLCQWASHLGATVIGTVGSRDKARLALTHGCTYPILYAQEDFVARVMEITQGRGCDVIYDAIGGDSVNRSFEALALRGHIVSFGQAAGPLDPLDIAGFATKSAKISRPNYGHYAGTPEQVRTSSRRLFSAIERGILKVDIGQRFPLRDAAEAHRRIEARETTGSTVLLP
jgi:NADPH:quinone reductase-like Zn-dependent oxidoreductase